jgi:hypothetical protein
VCRSEYLQALRPVEESGASTWPLYLSEITDPAALLSIITEPAKAQKVDVDPNASKQLTDWWSEARLTVFRRRAQRVGAEGVADVGLLHFQALLWSFKHWAVKRGLSSRITKQDVNDYAAERLGRPEVGADDGLRLFEDALAGYVRGRAGLLSVRPTLRTGERTRTLDWENGPRVMLARVAPAMMATGYKQAQSLYSLIPYALSDELKPTPARQLSQQLLELGTSEDPSGSRGEVTRRFGVQGAGIAADWDKREVVEEMIDCLHAALQIMSGDANILREFDRPGQPIYELVHDGMGTALAKWAQSFVEQAEAKVGVIAAQPGRFMDASIDGEALLKMSGSERRLWGGVEEHAKRRGQAVLRGLRWPASLVKATIKDVVFQGCDFVGASFSECKLQNVTFEHCKLIGAVMINCELDGVTFVGGQSPDIEENQDEWLDLFTIKYTDRYFERESDASSRAAAKVTFEGLKLTTGLFLQGLITGTWTLTRSNIRNLVITAHQHVIDAHEEVGIVFERTFVVPLSVYSGGVSVTRDASSSIFRLSTD